MAINDEPESSDEAASFDKDKLAVALKYERGKSDIPRVSAKGKGVVAESIIEMAKRHNIEVRQDSDLAVLLSKLDIDMPIPLEAYAAVAEILAYIYKANANARKNHS